MYTYAIGAANNGKDVLYVEGMRDAYPFPKWVTSGKHSTSASARRYIEAHKEKLLKLLARKGYPDHKLVVIQVNAVRASILP